MEILVAERASAFSLTFGAGEAITSAATLRGKAFLTQRFTSTDHTIQLMVRTLFNVIGILVTKPFYFCSAVIVSFCRDDIVLQALVFKTFISGPGDCQGNNAQ